MDSTTNTFLYLSEHKAIVCREHGYAVENLKRHIQQYHCFSRQLTSAVVDKFRSVERTPVDCIPQPASSESPPIDGLATPRNAFQCVEDDCRLISIGRSNIAQHCNQAHGWRSTPQNREHWRGVRVQSFCATPGKQRWFVVRDDTERSADEIEDLAETATVDQEQLIKELKEIEVAHDEAARLADKEMAKTDQTGWWKRTGWVEHLAGSDKRFLAHAARLPGKDEALLGQIADLVEDMIEQSVGGLSTLPHELRRWLKSAQIAEVDQRPMGRLQNSDSQDRYATYWKRLICYAIRVLRNGEVEDGSEQWTDISDDAMSDGEDAVVRRTPDPREDCMQDARRLFVWKHGQKAVAERLLDSIAANEPHDRQLQALLEFSGTFIFQKVYSKPFDSPLLHFMAVLGIDEENDRLRTGNDYSYMLAGLVYCVRVIALEVLLPAGQRDEQNDAEFDVFLDQRRKYLADGSMSVVSNMISLLAYGKNLALNHANAGMVFWEKEYTVMKLHGMRIVMDDFRAMAVKAIADAEDLFWEKLMWTDDRSKRFTMDLFGIHDDVTFRKRGAYFVTNKQNNLHSKWEEVTLTRMLASSCGKRMQKGGVWQVRRVKEYIRLVDKFCGLSLFGVHNTSAQPARGTEILSLRYKNGYLQDRNLFVLDGQVMTVIRYNKTQSQWDVPKVVPRFLPWRLGQLLCLYLVYVQPLASLLSSKIGYGPGMSEYIWATENGPWDTSKLTRILKERTGEALGVSLGTLDYRHAAIGIGRQYVGDEFARGSQESVDDIEEPEIETEDPLDISAGRGSGVGASRYAVRSDIVKHLSQRSIDTFRPLSESWHHFLGLKSKGDVGTTDTRKRTATLQTPSVKRRKIGFHEGYMTPMTSSRSAPQSSGAPKGYPTPSSGLLVPESSCVVATSPSRQPATGTTPWLTSSPPVPPPIETTTSQQRDNAVRKALSLREGEHVTFRSPQQEEALDRILNCSDSALTVVLPTGGGKTLLFTAPACLEDPEMNVVVVPYRQLINETVRAATAVGIDCVEWTSEVEDPADLVVVSADRLNDRFFDYAARMVSKGILRRVFVDECHLAITAHSWRERMVVLSKLQSIEAPLFMLTATLPVHMEVDLEDTMSSVGSVTWIRARTMRTTMKYTVRMIPANVKLMAEVTKVCKKRLARLRHKAKMVVYCRTKDECKDLASELGCGYFYSGSPSNEQVIERWMTVGGCVVATTALGTGVNYPGIELTVHAGLPYGLIDFAQESGRAGRGGEQVDSLILAEAGWEAKERERRRRRRQEWSRDEEALLEFVNTSGCRRLVLGQYFDEGITQDCISGNMAHCDRCGSGPTDRWRSQSDAAQERAIVEGTLDQMANGCPACWIAAALGSGRGWLHEGGGCRRRRTTIIEGEAFDLSERACDEFRSLIRYLDGSRMCHSCGISQKMCRTREEGQGPCQWPRIAVVIIRAAMASAAGRSIIQKAGFDGAMGDWARCALWLGQCHRLRMWGELVSNSMIVVKEFLIHCSREPSRMEDLDDDSICMDDEELPPSNGEFDEIEDVSTQDIGPRIQAREVGRSFDLGELARLMDRWKNVCVICRAQGSVIRGRRSWKDCSHPDDDKSSMEKTVRLLKSVDFAAYSGCLWCHRPQAACELWIQSRDQKGRVKYTRRAGQKCEYGDTLREATAALLAFGGKDGPCNWQKIQRDVQALKDEMGKKFRFGEVECSGMCLHFYRWG